MVRAMVAAFCVLVALVLFMDNGITPAELEANLREASGCHDTSVNVYRCIRRKDKEEKRAEYAEYVRSVNASRAREGRPAWKPVPEIGK